MTPLQASLAGGELSPYLYGRVDLARYQTSLALCRNAVVQPYGGVANRPGTKFIGTIPGKARLIPFRVSRDQQYVLEFTDKKLRVWWRGGGAPVAELTTPYGQDDLAQLRYAQSADVLTICHPAHAPHNLSRALKAGVLAWSLKEHRPSTGPWCALNLDKTQMVAASGTVGLVILTAGSPMFDASSHEGRLLQMEQRTYGQPWEVDKAVSQGDVRRSDGKYYEAKNSGKTGTLRPTHWEGTWSDGSIDWLYLHSGYGIVRVDKVNSPTEAAATVIQTLPRDLVRVTGYVPPPAVGLAGARWGRDANGYLQIELDRPWNIPEERVGGLARLTGPGGSVTYPVRSLGLYDLTLDAPFDPAEPYGARWTSLTPPSELEGSGATDRWRWGAWGGDQGWPQVVGYHQQRRVYGATAGQPETLWFSRTDSYSDFSTSAPIQDDDAITVSLAAQQVHQIRGLLTLDRLVVLTSSGEWVIASGEGPLTPTSINARLQGYRGSGDVPPLGVGDVALFLQEDGRVVRDLGYDFSRDAFVGADLTVMASHLLEGRRIVSWAFQQDPFQVLWAIRDDGALLGLTYLREQQVMAWHQHHTEGAFEDVCVISENGDEVAYFVINRNGARLLERMGPRRVDDIRKACFLDSSLSYDGSAPGGSLALLLGTTWDQGDTITAECTDPVFKPSHLGGAIVYQGEGTVYRLEISEVVSTTAVKVQPNQWIPEAFRASRADWSLALREFAGLEHLARTTLSSLADGHAVQAELVDGKAFIPTPAVHVTIGLPYTSDLQTLDPSLPGAATIMERKKQITSVRVLLHETRNVMAGRTFDELFEQAPRSFEPYDAPPKLQTGVVDISIPCSWERSGQVCLRQDAPLPVTWLAILPELQVGG